MAGGVEMLFVFVVMAIDAKQFPVAAIGWVVGVVVVTVVHGQFRQAATLE